MKILRQSLRQSIYQNLTALTEEALLTYGTLEKAGGGKRGSGVLTLLRGEASSAVSRACSCDSLAAPLPSSAALVQAAHTAPSECCCTTASPVVQDKAEHAHDQGACTAPSPKMCERGCRDKVCRAGFNARRLSWAGARPFSCPAHNCSDCQHKWRLPRGPGPTSTLAWPLPRAKTPRLAAPYAATRASRAARRSACDFLPTNLRLEVHPGPRMRFTDTTDFVMGETRQEVRKAFYQCHREPLHAVWRWRRVRHHFLGQAIR